MHILARLLTLFKGTPVGEDSFGNRYFSVTTGKNERRFVIYKSKDEATAMPPLWHGWMHHIVSTPPVNADDYIKYPWMKEHQTNTTGTEQMNKPNTAKNTGGAYLHSVPWTPPSE
jgi:NADH:ubiquinone oxidoreductase subunit